MRNESTMHDINKNLNSSSIQIVEIKAPFGVEIKIDLSNPLSDSQKNILKELLYQYKVLVIKNLLLDDSKFQYLASLFGEFFVAQQNNPSLGSKDSDSSIVVVGNKADEFEFSYLGSQEVLPHSDHQWLEKPSSASLLYAIDIELGASPTIWYDMAKIYADLSQEVKNEIQHLKIITYNPFYRPFGSVSAKYVNKDIDIPDGETYAHPLVRTHPFTGVKSLYLHQAYEMEFTSLAIDKGECLMELLHREMDQSLYKYEHKWQNNDVVIWDNSSTVHYRPMFDKNIRRVLKRISLKGEKPI